MSEAKDLAAVFTAVKIGKKTIKNRLVFPSMCTFFSDDRGSITPRIREFVRSRAHGGVGMFILPGTPYGSPSRGRPAISGGDYIAEWRNLREMASSYGMSLFCQLHPSRIQAGRGKKTLLPEDYTIDEIQSITRAYAEGSHRAQKAGLDGVEIHGAHAHEIAQFLSPVYNHRKDGYGGDLEGRSRFALEVIRSIKQAAGDDFPVIFRFSAEEYIPGGRELAESIKLAHMLVDAGADALHISVGIPDSEQWISPPMEVSPGFSVHLASEVKRAVPVPVIAVGRINDLFLASQIIKEDHADLVAMGRALLADPNLPRKSREGKTDAIRRCIACNQGCRLNLKDEVLCLQNPRAGRETMLNYSPVAPGDKKAVLIAGAGPAGLEAACVLSERGHHVKVYEQRGEPGGTFLLASKPPFKEGILEVIRYRLNRLRKLGVEINTNKKVDLKTLEDVAPDVVIVATGSSPAYPSFPMKGKEIYSADEVLSGTLPTGSRILVLGGGMAGCEVADYLAHRGYEIDIVERLTSAASDLTNTRRVFLLERLKENGVGFMLGATPMEVNLPWARVAFNDHEEVVNRYDSVVYAVGRKANGELEVIVKKCSLPVKVFTVGDASSPRTALEAIHEAALLAAEI